MKPKVYKPRCIVTPTKEYPTIGDQSEFSFDEEQSEFNSDEEQSEYTTNDEQLNFVPRRRGFGPRIVYE